MLTYVAQDIANVASNITGYPVILTDENSIIIGADMANMKRLGTLHEASIRTIKEGKQFSHTEEDCKKLSGTYPGTTMPIIIDDDVVGTIGIRGDSHKVIQFGLLVKMIAEIMLKDRIEAESAHVKHSNVQMLASMIVAFSGSNAEERAIATQAKFLNYNLSVKRIAAIISLTDFVESGPENAERDLYNTVLYRRIRKSFSNKQDIVVAQQNGVDRYLLFVTLGDRPIGIEMREFTEKCEALSEKLRSEGIRTYMSIGTVANDIHTLKESFDSAFKTFEIAARRGTEKVLSADDIPFEQLIADASRNLEGKKPSRDFERIMAEKDSEEYMNLIVSWCESMFNFTKTAETLNIHRNTLKYRFDKIYNELSLDMHDFKRVISLYFEINVHRYNQTYSKNL